MKQLLYILLFFNILNANKVQQNIFNPQQAQTITYKVKVTDDNNQIVLGTAVSLSSDGKLITAYHVIDTQKNITVINNKGISYKAKLGKVSLKNDLAYLYIDAKNIPFVKLANKTVLGENIYILSYDNLLLKGIVSKNNKKNIIVNLDTKEGTSGGGVFNKNNELIAILLNEDILTKTSYAVKPIMFKEINETFLHEKKMLSRSNNYDTSYCENKDDLKVWAKIAKSDNLKIQEYHALFIGLCKKVKNHDLTTDEAQVIFENAKKRLFNK